MFLTSLVKNNLEKHVRDLIDWEENLYEFSNLI